MYLLINFDVFFIASFNYYRTFAVHFIPKGGETCQFPWRAFLCPLATILYGGSVPPCGILMYLLPFGVKCNGTGGTALIFRKSSPSHLILIGMDTEFLTAQQSEDLQRLSGNPSPFSEEELKDFYLKLARLVNPGACSPKRTDFEVLSILSKDLKRNLGFLCKYTQHSWDEGLLEIQMACGVYSVQDSISKAQRLEMNTSLGRHLQFLARMASSCSVARKMHAEYTRHFINVEYLLRQMGK